MTELVNKLKELRTLYDTESRPHDRPLAVSLFPRDLDTIIAALSAQRDEGMIWHPDPKERLSRERDIILEAINAYDGYMLDDDFDAHNALRKIIERMRDRIELTAAPLSTQDKERVNV